MFLAGEEIFGGPEDGGSTDEAIISLDKKLAGVSVVPEGERVSAFQQLVASALNKSKVLDQLLRVQKLDAYDIEGAILAYEKFIRMTDDAGQLRLYTEGNFLGMTECGRYLAVRIRGPVFGVSIIMYSLIQLE